MERDYRGKKSFSFKAFYNCKKFISSVVNAKPDAERDSIQKKVFLSILFIVL
jgi:hypothetical protein